MSDHLDRCAANVAEARARAGLADPAAQAAHHAAAQAHVPRIVDYLNDTYRRALYKGDRAGQIEALARDARKEPA